MATLTEYRPTAAGNDGVYDLPREPTDEARRRGTWITDDMARDSRWSDDFRQLDGPFRLYDLHAAGVVAHRQRRDGSYVYVGHLGWYPTRPKLDQDGNPIDTGNVGGGIIASVNVTTRYRRRGLAAAILAFARDRYPDHHIRHSGALTDDGRAWAAAAP